MRSKSMVAGKRLFTFAIIADSHVTEDGLELLSRLPRTIQSTDD